MSQLSLPLTTNWLVRLYYLYDYMLYIYEKISMLFSKEKTFVSSCFVLENDAVPKGSLVQANVCSHKCIYFYFTPTLAPQHPPLIAKIGICCFPKSAPMPLRYLVANQNKNNSFVYLCDCTMVRLASDSMMLPS